MKVTQETLFALVGEQSFEGVMKKLYTEGEFAEMKNTTRQYINKIKRKGWLRYYTIGTQDLIIDCPQNHEHFR